MDHKGFRRVYMKQSNARLSDIGYDSLIAVFIDANSAQFCYKYQRDFLSQGHQAGMSLQQQVVQFLQKSRTHDPRAYLLMYVHASLRQLAKRFRGESQRDTSRAFNCFKEGFCTRRPGSEIILADLDVGHKPGKKSLEALIRLTVTDTRCTQVILSGTPMDECYRIRNESGLTFDQQKRLRVTHFWNIFAQNDKTSHVRSISDAVVDGVQRASVPGSKRASLPVVGPERLEGFRAAINGTSRRFSAATPSKSCAMPCNTPTRDPIVTQILRDNRKANGHVSVLKNSLSSPTGISGGKGRHGSKPQVSSTLQQYRVLRRDQYGRRLDPPLQPHPELLEEVEKWRLCNKYHLLSAGCSFPNCKHLHMVEDGRTGQLRDLTAEEQTALRMMARRSPCRNGTSCNDVECFAGHRCPNHVIKGAKKCSFPAAMHFAIRE